MNIKLLNEHNVEFLSLKEGYTGSSESFMSKCHIVGNHMSRLICHFIRSNKDELYIFKIFFKSFTPDKRQCTWVTSFSERDGQSDCKLAVTR